MTLRFIAIEGPIGVGKTTLARRLAGEFGAALLLEGAAENPFLERFYADPRRHALQVQLFFLFQRIDQLRALRQPDLFGSVRVSDYLLEKDRLFAELTLDAAEFALYDSVWQRVVEEPPRPDLVIWLQAPVPVLLERIARRGIACERHIDAGYLESLSAGYRRLFRDYDRAPVLAVDTVAVDLVGSDADYTALVAGIRRHRQGQQQLHPDPNPR